MTSGMNEVVLAVKCDLQLAFEELWIELMRFQYDIIKSVAVILGLQFIVLVGALAGLFHLYR